MKIILNRGCPKKSGEAQKVFIKGQEIGGVSISPVNAMMKKGLFVAVLILSLSAAVRGAWPWC